MNPASPEKNHLKDEYDKYALVRHLVVNELKEHTENILTALDSSPVVSGRIKNFSSFFSKYLRLLKTGTKDPKITDLLGVRIICPFIEDLQAAETLIENNFTIVEREIKGHATFKEFGYESTHLLISIPQAIVDKHGNPGTNIAEIQIRTILQDAWAEVEHELVYKAEFSPFDEPMKRKLAAVNASLSLADIIFQEIRSYQRKFTKEMGRRRESFFAKIEESTDDLLFASEHEFNTLPVSENENIHISQDAYQVSIDDLLVNALSAHNQNRFNEAISQYTHILDLKPASLEPQNSEDARSANAMRSIIYKHRGMAHFACSRYNEAIDDFTSSLKLDPQAYKSAYYRGVVQSVLKQYSHAIDDYTLSLSINPYQSFCLFRRGQAYYHIGDYPQGLADCENSLSLEPNNNSTIKFKELLLKKLKF
ncbi:MAG: (p)ppGpp synthetase [Treponema sp.]|nr:(p)ppGpp synthetase [Treponema sp.]